MMAGWWVDHSVICIFKWTTLSINLAVGLIQNDLQMMIITNNLSKETAFAAHNAKCNVLLK